MKQFLSKINLSGSNQTTSFNKPAIIFLLLNLAFQVNALAITPAEACPEHPDVIIDGHACNHQTSQLQYVAFAIINNSANSGFKQGGTLTSAYDLNDHSQVVGMAYTTAGILHSTRVDINRQDFSSQTFVDLGEIGKKSAANGINNNSLSAGYQQTSASSNTNQAVAWREDGTVLVLMDQGSATAAAINTNNMDLVSGYGYRSELGGTYGFIALLNNNAVISTTLLTQFQNWPNDINDSMHVAGAGSNGNFNRAYTCDPGLSCTFLENTSFYSTAYSINNNIQPIITGTVLDILAGGFQPVIWTNNNMSTLAHLAGAKTGYANDVSDGGDIVGESGSTAVIWRNLAVHNLNSLITNNIGTALKYAISINRHGEILAMGSNHTPYILVPTENLN